MPDKKMTAELAGVEFIGLENEGMEFGGLENDGLQVINLHGTCIKKVYVRYLILG